MADASYRVVPEGERAYWHNDDSLFDDLSAGDINFAKSDDGTTDFSSVTEAWNYLGNLIPPTISLSEEDEDTGGILITHKYAEDGMHEQLFELEFETSKLDSIHEKDIDNDDIGWASIDFYKDVAGTETKWTPADQADLDSNCIRTDLSWMPDIDYMIKGGWVAQAVIPTVDIYVWTVGADLDAVYGGPQSTFLEGGLNLYFSASHKLLGLEGVSATKLEYSHPTLGDGKGTNRMRFIVRHPAGHNHRLQAVFDIFRA